jgi:hypothetical protein
VGSAAPARSDERWITPEGVAPPWSLRSRAKGRDNAPCGRLASWPQRASIIRRISARAPVASNLLLQCSTGSTARTSPGDVPAWEV